VERDVSSDVTAVTVLSQKVAIRLHGKPKGMPFGCAYDEQIVGGRLTLNWDNDLATKIVGDVALFAKSLNLKHAEKINR